MKKVTVIVENQCMICGNPSFVEVDADRLVKYTFGRVMKLPSATHSAQVIFPELSANDREILISGTHPQCWELLREDEEE